jgi:hypothetical protein
LNPKQNKITYLGLLPTYLFKIKIFIMLIDKLFPFYKYIYIRISLFLCMHVQTNVGQISQKSWYPPQISIQISKMVFNKYHYGWYLSQYSMCRISPIMIDNILVFGNYVGYQRCWYPTWISNLRPDIKVNSY